MMKYIPTSKEFNILAKSNGKIYTIEFIRNCYENASIQDIVLKDLLNVCLAAGQDPGLYVSKWISLANYLSVVRYNDEVVGFSIAHEYKKNAFFFVATMISNKHNNQSLGKYINYYLIRSFFWRRIKNPFRFFRPLHFIFRTQNPILYSTWNKHTELYPSLANNIIPEDIKELAVTFVKDTWGSMDFDPERFIIHDAYKNTPGLAIKPNKVQWVKNQEINALFEERLHLSKGSIDALVIVGKISKALQFATLAFKPKI